MNLIKRLLLLRDENKLLFQLIVICWPFEWEYMAAEMQLSRDEVLELQLLNRKTIAELIQTVIRNAGYIAPNEIVRELNNQADGRPGLAVQLTVASLNDNLQRVLRGDYLATVIERCCRSFTGKHATQILAAFAVGGKAGMGTKAVANALEISIVSMHDSLRNMAPAGILETLSQNRLATRPGALRRALLKEVFFKADSACLPRDIWEKLFDESPDRDEALCALLNAAHVDAVFDMNWLHGLIAQSETPKVWALYAGLGADSCKYVLEKHPEQTPHIVDEALHHIPKLIIPFLLKQAITDVRPLNAHPDAPLRKLSDWVLHGRPGSPDAVYRRKALFECAVKWIQDGGNYIIALKAFVYCFDVGFRSSDTDPGDGMTVTFSSGLLSTTEIEEITKLWPQFIDVLYAKGISDWKPVTTIIQGWLHPYNWLGKEPGAEYENITRSYAKRMIEDVVALSNGHNGFLRWAVIHAEEVGITPDKIPLSDEYRTLFPIKRLSADWELEEKENIRKAESLIASWAGLSICEIFGRLKRYELEATAMEHRWPRLSPIVCRLLAEQREFSIAEMKVAINQDIPADMLDPFIASAVSKNIDAADIVRECTAHENYRHLAVFYILTGKQPYDYLEIKEMLPKYAKYIEDLAYNSSFPEGVMLQILQHEDWKVRLAAALAEFRSASKGEVRDSVRTEWRRAIVDGVASLGEDEDLRAIHDLDAIISYDRTLAFDILIDMASKGDYPLSMWGLTPLDPLLNALNYDERLNFLGTCEKLFMTEVPRVLIGNDLELYREFLGRPEMKRHHLTPLIGSPTDSGWIDKALIALAAGYSPMHISLAARGNHWGGWGPMSAMWQKWVDSFEPLLNHTDPRAQTIGKAGLEWSTQERDCALRKEKAEDIHGRFEE
ncbi:MAG: hypothetical protein HY801_11080 [Candidatus Lindowbacteria bacterium]|nr:hypothetical protein [Candidatus Lindowbacteria bacterium]